MSGSPPEARQSVSMNSRNSSWEAIGGAKDQVA